MRARTLLLFAFAVIAAGATFYLAQNWMSAQRGNLDRVAKQAPKLAPTVEVLVAGRELVAGQFIKEKHLRWQAWPKKGLPDTYFVKGAKRKKQSGSAADIDPKKSVIESFIDSVVRSRISPGEPITDGRVVRPGDRGFLAAVLQPGMRAISVPINATTGISGFVFPGDRVDLLLTHSIASGDEDSRRATETVMSDVRVLAVDQRTDDTEGKAELAKTATLEVTPKQAEVIAVANEMGRLSLSLRSLAIVEPAAKPLREKRTYTWDSEASRLLHRKGVQAGMSVRVFRGTVGTAVNFQKKPGQAYQVTGGTLLPGTGAAQPGPRSLLPGATTNAAANGAQTLNVASKKVN